MIHEPVFTSWHVTRCHDMRLRYHRSHVTLHMCHGGLQSWELMMIVNPNMTQLLRLGPRSEHSESKPVLWDVRDQIECHLKPERGEICGIMTGITQTPDRMNEWKRREQDLVLPLQPEFNWQGMKNLPENLSPLGLIGLIEEPTVRSLSQSASAIRGQLFLRQEALRSRIDWPSDQSRVDSFCWQIKIFHPTTQFIQLKCLARNFNNLTLLCSTNRD